MGEISERFNSTSLGTGRPILLVGDVMLDRFYYGDVTRISPEAPVPVLKITDQTTMLGGAANTAANIAALGRQVALLAPIGDDEAGTQLRSLAQNTPRLSVQGPIDPRGTIVKSRYSAAGQQLLRIDAEDTSPLDATASAALSADALGQFAAAALLVLSDYAKGVLSAPLCRALIEGAQAAGLPIVVDPKGSDFSKYHGATVITPNELELAAAAGRTPRDEADIIDIASSLARQHHFTSVAVTRGKNGVMLVGPEGLLAHIPSFALDVFDVSGAGDSFVAGLSCALSAGDSLIEAVHYGNAVAGVAVGKLGTATVTPREVERLIAQRAIVPETIVTTDYTEVARLARLWREDGAKVGFTNGVFDLLHLGHIRTLKAARAACDRLILAINDDASVKRLKGESRPVQSAEVRSAILANMNFVDLVVIFSEDTPLEVIRAAQPDLLYKGGDYTPESVVGADIVAARGGEVRIVPTLQGYSTTSTIARIHSDSPPKHG